MLRKLNSRLLFMTSFSLFGSMLLRAQEPVDPHATKETRAVYKNLFRLSKSTVLFGHQDALAYGVGWKDVPGKSDIKEIVREHPAVNGWDIGLIEMDSASNLDKVSFSKMKEYIREGYRRGAVITISWHLRNPLSGGSAWDTTKGTVASILPGGPKHELYKNWLNKVAVFMQDLKGPDGEPIPVLFRPFHELTGNWFWWCKNVCTPEEFKKLWVFTTDYLSKEKKLHHLLYVFNVADFNSREEFMERYPGDNKVDMVSFDSYQFGEKTGRDKFISKTRFRLEQLCAIAKEKNKLAAFAETGYEGVPDQEWWTKTLLPAIKGFPISYVLVWRNAGLIPGSQKMHYYAPYPGQESAADFEKFFSRKGIFFEKKIQAEKIYN